MDEEGLRLERVSNDVLEALGLDIRNADYRLARWPNGLSAVVEIKFDDYAGYFFEAKVVVTGERVYLRHAGESGVVLAPLTTDVPLNRRGIIDRA